VQLPFGWVRLHDAAVLGVSPAAPLPGEPDGAPSGINASAALGNDVANFGTCAATRQQLIDLQSAAKAVEAAR
jgi:broad specificity polyphosphatase/5'/3'-nucleotidase SurE